jgi:predicted MPP superfamily phosphohydrolase
MTRRRFLKLGIGLGLAGPSAYANRIEPFWLEVRQQPGTVAGLPSSLDGLRIVQLADLHLGPWVPLDYLNRALALANRQSPDLIVLTGDYIQYRARYISPVYTAMARLHAPLGVYGVLGNHDQWEDADLVFTRREMKRAGIVDLTNRGVLVRREGGALWLAGVADLWTGHPDLRQALAQVPPGTPVILLSHNPDFIEEQHDPRVSLMLAGHTHGGQVLLPLLGPIYVPSKYGAKYAAGLVRQGPTQVYITRGVGMIFPLRFRCRPEVTVLTLHAGPASTL